MPISIPATFLSNTLFPGRIDIFHHPSSRHFLKPSQFQNPTSPFSPMCGNEWIEFPGSQFRIITSKVTAGPSGIEASVLSKDSRLLDRVEVFDLEGNGIPITDLWKERKAVVAFARHFGCVLCRRRADLLASKKDRMDASGVALILIGPGTIDQAKAFFQQTKFKGEIYADPNHSSYEALKFVYGISTVLTPGAGLKIIQSYIEGYRQDWKLSSEKNTVAKGGWQQGGIIVAGPGKDNIQYIHRDKEAGDDPDIGDVLGACCS